MIARLSNSRWSLSEARRIASGLIERIERLPLAAAAGKDDRAARSTGPTIDLNASSVLIYAALALALLVGLIASGYLSFDR
jgi:hypothetical protein